MNGCRESAADDRARSSRLLGALETSTEAPGHAGDLDEFEQVVMFGIAPEFEGLPYPPAGHTYPRR
ncbi:hypothetical protein [Streptantibioticus silvisoli]|uniref:Uncharacterized protein n=1 Tax=Streptantibioticus silvisoli TaxID=2705255 RepID=A0ABT6W271_9ACTN|nr:hypothetical protein [Streptantibioticus silvisoli]MDI5964838.1 hypothetical protein [Streptantibioticus silvisoli]